MQSCQSSANTNDNYFTADDFSSVKKIDVHTHVQTTGHALLEQAKADNFTLISINTEVPGYPPIDSQQFYALEQQRRYPDKFFYLTTFETATRFQPDWAERQLEYLKKSFTNGAIGIKVWKNIGMEILDKDGHFIMIDHPMFDPIFNYLEQNNIPVCGHIGEPLACWLPLDKMTTNNDRAYFKDHPEYHMYLHPEYPSYEDQIQSRDRLLEKHPRLKFIGAHLGSLEWSVEEMAKRLDKFSNMALDFAERVGHVQYQTVNDWQRVHDFFVKYQDRLMYGTDLEENESTPADSMKVRAHDLWVRDWKYFTSGDSMESPLVNGKFKGLKLPKEVVEKLYYKNAASWYLKK